MVKQLLAWTILCLGLLPGIAMGQADLGPFTVTTTEGTAPTYDSNAKTLTFTTTGKYEVAQKDATAPTDVRMVVTASGTGTVEVTLAGVDIQPSENDAFNCGSVAVTLISKEGTVNKLEGSGASENATRYPGIYKSSDKQLLIKGSGSLEVKGRDANSSRYASPGIGKSVQDHWTEGSTSNVHIEGGRVSVVAGTSNYLSYGIDASNITISGGTVTSNGRHTLPTDKPVTITGGSVNAPFGKVLKDQNTQAYKTALQLNGLTAATKITSFTLTQDGKSYTYGFTDMYTDANGKIYLWLPAGKYNISLEAGNTQYHNPYVTVYSDKTNEYILADGANKSISLLSVPIGASSVQVSPKAAAKGETVTLTIASVTGGAAFTFSGLEGVTVSEPVITNNTTYTYTFAMPDRDIEIGYSVNYYTVIATDGGVIEQTNDALKITTAGSYTISNALGADKVCMMPIQVTASGTGTVEITLAGVNIQPSTNAAFDCGSVAVTLISKEGTVNKLEGSGANLYVTRYPGIYKNSGQQLLIKGSGSLEVKGRDAYGTRYGSPGIGRSTWDNGKDDPTSNVHIEGGRVSVVAGTSENLSYGIDASNITISGGTVTSNGHTLPADKPVTITGGSVNAPFGKVLKDQNTQAYKAILQLLYVTAATKITSLKITSKEGGADYTYGITDMYTDANGKIYLWLPEGTYTIDANGYTGKVAVKTDNSASATLYKYVEITGETSYSDNDHRAAIITVKPAGIFTVAVDNASVGKLTVEAGGKLVTTKALAIEDGFVWQRSLDNKWTAFCSPVAFTATTPAIASVVSESGKLWLQSGFTTSSDQRWAVATAVAANTPYLLAGDANQTAATFTADGKVTLPEAQTIDVPSAGIADGALLFTANPSLTVQELEGIYVVDVAKQEVVLKEGSYALQPFEAFFIASKKTQNSLKSFSLKGNTPTGVSEVLDNRFRAYGDGSTLVLSNSGAAGEVAVFDLSGRCLFREARFTGDKRLAGWPHGAYIVRYGQIAIKVILK